MAEWAWWIKCKFALRPSGLLRVYEQSPNFYWYYSRERRRRRIRITTDLLKINQQSHFLSALSFLCVTRRLISLLSLSCYLLREALHVLAISTCASFILSVATRKSYWQRHKSLTALAGLYVAATGLCKCSRCSFFFCLSAANRTAPNLSSSLSFLVLGSSLPWWWRCAWSSPFSPWAWCANCFVFLSLACSAFRSAAFLSLRGAYVVVIFVCV